MSKQNAKGFLVKFQNVGRGKANWEERIERPVTNDKIVAAVRRKNVLASKGIDAKSTSDYSGIVTVGLYRVVGTYFIVPGSEVRS